MNDRLKNLSHLKFRIVICYVILILIHYRLMIKVRTRHSYLIFRILEILPQHFRIIRKKIKLIIIGKLINYLIFYI